MSRWIHWTEQPEEPDDCKIPYSTGDCFFYTEYKEGDSLSPKVEEYFNISVNPDVSIDLTGIMYSLARGDSDEAVETNYHVDLRDWCATVEQSLKKPPEEFELIAGGSPVDFDQMARKYPRAARRLAESGMSFMNLYNMEGHVAKRWDAAAPGNWSDNNNWFPLNAPAAGDDIDFTNSTQQCTVDAVAGNMATCDITVDIVVTCNVDLTFTGAFAQSAGTFTPNATNVALQSTLTISGSGTFGGNSAYHLNLDGNFSLTNPGTFNAPNDDFFTMAGALFTFTSGTYNTDNGGITFDRAAAVTTLGANSPPFYQLTVANGTTLSLDAVNHYTLTASNTTTLNGTLTCDASTVSLGTLLAVGFAVTIASTGVLTGGTGTHTIGSIYVDDGTWTATQGVTTLNGGAGSDPYQLQITASATFTHSSGTVTSAKTGGAVTWNFFDSETFYILTVATTSRIVTLLSDTSSKTVTATTCTITSGELTLDAAVNTNLTTTSACNVTGTLTCGAATVSCTGTGISNFSIRIDGAGAVFNGGTGAHTFGSIGIGSATGTGTAVLTTGTTTINNVSAFASVAFAITGVALTFDDGDGTVAFTYAGAQKFYAENNVAQTFYNLTVNNASAALTYYASKSFALTVANNLTITAGSFTTWDGTTSADLTVQSGASITGTLDCKAATVSCTGTGTAQSMSIQINANGTFTGGSGAHTFGSFYALGNPCSVTLSSGNTTINSSQNGTTIAFAWGVTNVTFAHGSGTVIFTKAAAQTFYETSNTARTLYNLTVNNASAALSHYAGASFALTVANNLTITAGSFTTWDGTTSANLTTTGFADITGTLDCKASAVSIRSGSATDGILLRSGGTFTGGSGAHTIGSIYIYSGATACTLTSNTTTINGSGSGSYGLNVYGNVIAHSNGTIQFTKAALTGIISNSFSFSFYNLTVNNSGTNTFYIDTAGTVYTLTIAGTLTSTTGNIDTRSGTGNNLDVTGTSSITSTLTPNTSTITFNGAVTVNNGGTLGGNTAWTCDHNANLTINAGGIFSAPNGSGTFNFSGSTFNNSGTYTANSGVVTWDSISSGSNLLNSSTVDPVFYSMNVSITSNYLWVYRSITIANTLTSTSGGFGVRCDVMAMVVTMGTASAAGAIVNNGGINSYSTASTAATIQGASVSYPCVCTGSNWTWGLTGGWTGNRTWNLKWLDIQFDATTNGISGSQATVNWTGNTGIRAWTVSAGDTTSCTLATVTITGTANKNLTVYGTIIMNGTVGVNLTYTNLGTLNCYGGSTVNLQYFTLRSNDSNSGYVFGLEGAGHTYTNLDNVTFTSIAGKYGAVWCRSSDIPTFTNCTFNNRWNGSGWLNGDIIILSGMYAQLNNCTLTNDRVAFQGPTGYISSITHNGVANAHLLMGILSAAAPTSAYQIQDADNVTLSNGYAYSSSFDSVLTLDQNETCAALTSAASTTLTPATYTLTTNGAVGLSGTLGGATAWTHDCNGFLSINAGGVYTAARTLNYSATSIVIIGTFTNNTTTFACDGTGAQALSGTFTVTNLTNSNTVGSVTITGITVSGVVTSSNVKLELITSTIVATTANCGSTGRIYVKDIQGVNGNFAIILADGDSQAYSDITSGVRADANDDVYIYLESGGTACTFSFDVAALNFGILYKQAGKTINITWGSYTEPGVPTSPAISTAVNAQLTFSWVTPASTGGWKIQGYDIWRSQTSGTETLHSEDGIVNTHVDTGLTARDVYYYQALSWNSVGDSALTAEVNAMVNGPPNVPQNLAISLEFDRSLCITWATPADNGNFAISAYKVYSDLTSPPTTLEATLGVVLFYQDFGITNRVLRYYKVTAVNSYGEGAASSIVSDTPECHSGLGFCSGNLTQTITIKPRSGTNKNGQPAFGNSFTAYGRITYSNRNARDNKGEVVLSKVQILVDGSVDVDSYDSITLSDGRTMPIIEVREIYQVISGTAITVQKEIYT